MVLANIFPPRGLSGLLRGKPKPENKQRDALQWRGLGAGTLRQTESEWNQLIVMLELAQHWQELIAEFTGHGSLGDGGGPAWPASR